jgi:ABC-type transporter Mla subunit MlaD
VLIRFTVDPAQIGDVPSFEEVIRGGLRARISAQGITGVNYVELDFVNPERFPVPDVPWTPRYRVIPSIPSTVAQVRSAAEQLVSRLSEVPLEQMATDLASLIAALNAQASNGDLATAINQAAVILSQLRGMLQTGDVEGAIGAVREAGEAVRDLAAAPELRETLTSAAAAAEELRHSVQRLSPALQSFERTMRTTRNTVTDVQSELLPILSDLRATSANLRAVTEQLRNSPSQFLLGSPPAVERRR